MNSKYNNLVLKVLSQEFSSTLEIVKAVQKKSGKVVNWHMIYRILSDFEKAGKVKKLELSNGIYWRIRR